MIPVLGGAKLMASLFSINVICKVMLISSVISEERTNKVLSSSLLFQ